MFPSHSRWCTPGTAQFHSLRFARRSYALLNGLWHFVWRLHDSILIPFSRSIDFNHFAVTMIWLFFISLCIPVQTEQLGNVRESSGLFSSIVFFPFQFVIRTWKCDQQVWKTPTTGQRNGTRTWLRRVIWQIRTANGPSLSRLNNSFHSSWWQISDQTAHWKSQTAMGDLKRELLDGLHRSYLII